MERTSTFKEIIFALLLCLLILLVLALIFYNFIPNNKTLPELEQYSTPAEISKELNDEAGADEERVVLTYQVDAPEVENYERINSYNPGRPNPLQNLDAVADGSSGTSGTSGSTASGSSSTSGSTASGTSSNSGSGASSSSSAASSNPASSGSTASSSTGTSSGSSSGTSAYANPAKDPNTK